eukprot:5436328-Prymnesium_polylepis.1
MESAETALLKAEAETALSPIELASALLKASAEGDADLVQALCDARADVSCVDSSGWTPLHQAGFRGHADCVLALCSSGAQVDRVTAHGNTPLHTAANQGHIECVRALAARGADVNRANPQGYTPLHTAVIECRLDAVRVLHEMGADINGCSFIMPTRALFHYATPIYLAAHRGLTIPCQLLSSYGAHRNGEEEAEAAERQEHVSLAAWLRASVRWTALHHLEVLTVERTTALLRSGADPHAGAPSPFDLARTAGGEVSALVRLASGLWSRESHCLFPAPARERA